MPALLKSLLPALVTFTLLIGCSQEPAEQSETETVAEEEGPPPSGDETGGTFRLYRFQSAIIEYEVGSPTMAKARRTTYIADWGTYQTEITRGERPDGSKFETEMITRGGEIYNIMPAEKLALKAEVQNRTAAGIDLNAMTQLLGGRQAALRGLKQRGITLLDSAEVAGQLCQVYEHQTEQSIVKMWAFDGVPLKMIVDRTNGDQRATMSEMEAVSVKLNVPVGAKHFEIPADYRVMTPLEYRDMLQAAKDSSGTKTEDSTDQGRE